MSDGNPLGWHYVGAFTYRTYAQEISRCTAEVTSFGNGWWHAKIFRPFGDVTSKRLTSLEEAKAWASEYLLMLDVQCTLDPD